VPIFKKTNDGVAIYNYLSSGETVIFVNRVLRGELFWNKEIRQDQKSTTISVNYDGTTHRIDNGLIVGAIDSLPTMSKSYDNGLANYVDYKEKALHPADNPTRNPDGSIYTGSLSDPHAVKYDDYVDWLKDFTRQAKYVSFAGAGENKYEIGAFLENGVVVNVNGYNLFVPAYPDLLKFYNEDKGELPGKYIPPPDLMILGEAW